MKKRLVLLLMVVVAGMLYRCSGLRWSDLTPHHLQAYLHSFGWWAPGMYLVLVAQPLIPLPVSVLAVAAGMTFGFAGGLLLVMVSSMIRGCGQFLLARLFGAASVQRLLGRYGVHLERWMSIQGFWTAFWLRVVAPVPYDVVNLGLGCSLMPFSQFFLSTMLGLIPGLTLWAYAGATLTDVRGYWKFLLVLGGFFALWQVARWSRSRWLRVVS